MFSYLPSSSSSSSFGLPGLQHYRDADSSRTAVDAEGTLLEYEALELRLHPPNISIDNESFPDRSVLILDSANRPGTLVEVVQCLTELGLSVKQARISSDGGWFVDEFHVSETPAGRVTDPRKLAVLKRVLSPAAGEPGGEQHTVFQVACGETPGLLADITQLLSHNGLDVQTAAAWTYNNRAAVVIGVTERDRVKLNRLRQLLQKMVSRNGDAAVSVEQVTGPVHHERRLHQLMLADEVKAWRQLTRLQQHHSLPFPAPISPHQHAGAADTDAESDQQPHTPRTPQQQWQRRMLPPQWTVKHNRPMLRPDVQHHDQQQQQCDRDYAALAAAAAGQPAQPAATGPGPAVDLNQQLAALQQPALLPPLPALPQQAALLTLAAPVSSAAGAAQQPSSVSDLMALLQLQPLPQARQQPKGELPGPAPAGAEPEKDAAASPTSAAAAADGGAAASGSGLPSRGPSATVNLPGLTPINTRVSSSYAPPGAGSLPASLSAPCSPLAPGRPSAALWSPAHIASAAAAAGVLSPRAALGRPHADTPAASAAAQRPGQLLAAAGGSAGGSPDAWAAPEVSVQYSSLFSYWLVTIRCADRNKLFFDTVVTLADLRLDIYHATIDSEPATGFANQLFYVRPRFGDGRWDERKAELLRAMLVSAVQRRFPPGLRVHVFAGSNACLQGLVEALRRQAITITRCKVRAYERGAASEARDTSHTFYLMGRDGSLPSRQQVQVACQAAGGELVDAPLDLSNPGVAAVLCSLDSRGRFAYSFASARSQQRAAGTSSAWPAAAPASTHSGGSDHSNDTKPSF